MNVRVSFDVDVFTTEHTELTEKTRYFCHGFTRIHTVKSVSRGGAGYAGKIVLRRVYANPVNSNGLALLQARLVRQQNRLNFSRCAATP